MSHRGHSGLDSGVKETPVELETYLLEWATKEMKFHSTMYMTGCDFKLPSKMDLKVLCQGPLANIWKYVMQHVKSVQTIERVKKNLAVSRHPSSQKPLKKHHSTDVSGRDEKLGKLEERQHLTSELANCQMDVDMLEREMEHAKIEVAQLEDRYQGVRHRVRDLQMKTSLLSVVSGHTGETVEKYNKYTKRVANRTRDVLFRGTDSLGNVAFAGTDKETTEELETESCRDARVTCEEICQFLQNSLSGTFTSDQHALEMSEADLWNRVERTAKSRRIGATVRALTQNTATASNNMRDDMVGLDIARDAQELSFSYKSSGQLQDTSTPPTVQKNLQQLLLASNREHVLRFFKEQEHKNESWKLEARLDDITAEIHKQAHKVLDEHPRNVPLAKSYVDALISAAVERSVVPCLSNELDSLVERTQQAKKEKEELRAKLARIQDFKNLVEKKQNLIGVLAKQNTSAPERLAEHKGQVLSYIRSRAMATHVSVVHHISGSLSDSLISEVEKFSPLPLLCMLSVQLDSMTEVCVTDLSLAPSQHPTVGEKLATFNNICTLLDFPTYKSADGLAQHILDLHHDLRHLGVSQQRRNQSIKLIKDQTHTTDDIQTIVELCDHTREHIQAHCEKVLPRLEKCLKTLTLLSKEVVSTKEKISIWSDQPAQFTTPWVASADGMTFDQWLQRWRVAMVQVHKVMSSRTNVPRKA